MTKLPKKLYPTAKETPKSIQAELCEFAQTNQGRVLSMRDLPDRIRDNAAAYQTKIAKTGYRLLSADSHPNLLVQGQFMFWPLDQETPEMLPPCVRKYLPIASGRPIGIDLFAGAGGLSMGFEQAGFDIAACVEIDPIHCATHEYNFPYAASICGSVIDLTGESIRRRSGIGDRDIDAVFGGAPCQGFSMIGKRALDDPRNRLVSHYVRLVKELRPKYCVFENVKGLTVGKQVQFLKELIAALEDAGYHVVLPYHVLNAADYGVPQNRFRLFLMACRNGQTPPAYPLPYKSKVTVEEAIGDLPDADRFKALSRSDAVPAIWKTKTGYAKKLRGQVSDPADFSYPEGIHGALAKSLAASEIFRVLNGTSSKLHWREVGERERIWCIDPAHPIAAGVPEHFELPYEEMYGEPFMIAGDAHVFFMSWFEGGEVFRSGLTLQRGFGRMFYFRPGHEAFPSFYNEHVLHVLANGIRWLRPTVNMPYPKTNAL